MNESRRTYEWGTWKLQDSVVGCRVRSYACESCYSWMNATCHSHMNALTVLGCRVPSSFLDHHLIACIVWCYSASQCVAVCCSVYRLQSLDESSSFLDVSAARKASWRRAFDPCTPLLFDLYRYLEQNGYFGLVPENAISMIWSILVDGFDTRLIPRSFLCGSPSLHSPSLPSMLFSPLCSHLHSPLLSPSFFSPTRFPPPSIQLWLHLYMTHF